MNLFDLFNPYTSLDKRLRLRLGGQQTGDSIIGQDGKGKYLRVEIIDLPLGTTQAVASTGLTSVGLSASGALSVSNSPLTANGTIALNWTGTSSQYVRGDGSLGTLPASGDPIYKGTASGTDTYTTTITGVTSYADGDAYLMRFTNGNTTSCTLNINGLGAKTLYRNNDGALIGGDIWAGAEMLCVFNSTLNGFQCIGTSPNSLFSYVTNAEATTITKGQPVYVFGGQGDRITVKLAYNTSDATSAQTIGIVASTSIGANQKGIIIIQGQLDNLGLFPTATWADGDYVYLGSTPGSVTNTKPYAPNHLVYLGYVTTASNGNAGRMYVKVQNGYELDEIHNVSAQTPSNNDGLFYNSTTSLWTARAATITDITGLQTALNGKLSTTLTSAQIFVGNASNIATGVSMSGDATIANTGALTIANGAVTLAKMANLAANSIIGNNTGSAATPIALTATQVTAMLNTFTSTLKGLVPASGGGTTNFLRADGTWASVSASAGGSNTQVQYNSSGALAGSASFTWDNTNTTLTIGTGTIATPRALNVAVNQNGLTAIAIQNTNTGTSGQAGYTFGQDLTNTVNGLGALLWYNSGVTSQMPGTSIPRANAVEFSSNNLNFGNATIGIAGSPIYLFNSTMGVRIDTTGLRINTAGALTTSNSFLFQAGNLRWDSSNNQLYAGSTSWGTIRHANFGVDTNGSTAMQIQNASTGTSASVGFFIGQNTGSNVTGGLFWYNTTNAGQYGGSLINAGGSLQIASSNSQTGVQLLYLNATPIVMAIGTTGTNYSARMDANGFRIGVLSGIGTANTANRIFQADNLQYTTTTNALNIANSAGIYQVNGTQVVSARNTGWSAQTATSSKADLGAIPTTAAIASFCRALYDALSTHGLIGT